MSLRFDYASLKELASRTEAVSQACSCMNTPVVGWESTPLSLREEQLRELGTLARSEEEEAPFDEYHPNGTRY